MRVTSLNKTITKQLLIAMMLYGLLPHNETPFSFFVDPTTERLAKNLLFDLDDLRFVVLRRP